MKKRILAGVLTVVLMLTTPMGNNVIFAEEIGQRNTESLVQKSEEYSENIDVNETYKINALTVREKNVTLDFNVVDTAQLLVAIYNESGDVMLGSGIATVTPSITTQTIPINIVNMPEYFVVRAYLIEKQTLRPLSKMFECLDYVHGVLIDENNFPDDNFRAYVEQKMDADKNGRLSENEIDNVLIIDVNNREISSLKGIEFFSKLKELYCNNNSLDSLDVSQNIMLEYLNCACNFLKELDVSQNSSLNYLDCSYMRLQGLDVSQNINLKTLWCESNDLSSLDMSKNKELTNLYCSINQLSNLDVTQNIKLMELRCDNNQLKNLDVSQNTALVTLYCENNELASLDVSQNIILQKLQCSGNQLKNLDVSQNTCLEILCCDSNQLDNLNVDQNVALTDLQCGGNQLENLDVSQNVALEILHCDGNQLNSLDVSQNIKLKGIQCSENQLKNLDVKQNVALQKLQCSGNQLENLDVSQNVALEILYCENNKLSSLDVSNNIELKTLLCDPDVKVIGWTHESEQDSYAISDNISEGVKSIEEETTVTVNSVNSSIEYSDLEPNVIYNFYVLKDENIEITTDNLLYVTQITADENGQVMIPYAYDTASEVSQTKIVGMRKMDIAKAEITIENMYYTGSMQRVVPIVTYKGTILKENKDYIISGEISAKDIGTYTIQIAGVGLYEGSLEKSYQILPVSVAGIILSKNILDLKSGETAVLTATITPETATNKILNWESSNPAVATVDNTGKVTAMVAGSAIITGSATDGSGAKATCKVTVTKSEVKVTKITLNKTNASIEKGKTLQLKATVTPTNATDKGVTWKSSNTKIATVSSTGKVTAKTVGTVTISCMAKDGSGKKAICRITVKNPVIKVTKITLNKTKATLVKGESMSLKATVTPTNTTNKGVTWKSSNTRIATVSSTGKVTAKAVGTVTISCTAKDGSGKKATCRITVRNYTKSEAYVARIYTKALGRNPEIGGLKYWTGEINAKRKTPVQVAEQFFFAPEFTNKKLNNTEYVKVLYRTFMGREADQGGLNYWVGRLNMGESRKSVLEAFAGCPEFRKIVKSFGL